MPFHLISKRAIRFVFEDIILAKKPKGEIAYPHKNLHVFSPQIIEKVGQLKNSRLGLLATLPIPTPLSLESFDAKRFLVLDGIEDLGELGTLIRSASAFYWDAVWITHSCGDPFDPACIRSSQGALFELPYRVGSIENALKHARKVSTTLKLKAVEGAKPAVRIGIMNADLTESTIRHSDSNICLLIQRSTKSTPKSTDFISVAPGGIMDPSVLPLQVSGSSLMYAIRDRYFNLEQ
jgi:hypothetical protein